MSELSAGRITYGKSHEETINWFWYADLVSLCGCPDGCEQFLHQLCRGEHSYREADCQSVSRLWRNGSVLYRQVGWWCHWRVCTFETLCLPLGKRIFSKTYPSFLTLKEGSTFLTKPLFPQGREDVTALRCSEPLRSKVGGPSKVSPWLCGMGPPGE